MSPLPPEFVGHWERRSIVVDGRSIDDAGRSWWFQSRDQFLDIRSPGGGLRAEMFAGVTTWNARARRLSWSHELDLHPGSAEDSGRVEWVDGDLVEHGTVPSSTGTIEYTEVWRRCDTDAPVIIADRIRGRGRFARSGPRAAVFIDDHPHKAPRGGQLTNRMKQWTFDATIGTPLACSSAPMPTEIGETFSQFGTSWTVVELTHRTVA